ncbi:capsule biosynthesis GfcC family protein [Vibrio ostreicida]|uniref:capsule biosynthesis GfcC family protein n=1 Tax=Vibrio ostreicida TaxID=526588 RepID=UPI000970DD8A|nr:capsule biosynthesis GfcC family protein [Vibrio ostreicida]
MKRTFLSLLWLTMPLSSSIAGVVTVELPSEQLIIEYDAPVRLERALNDTNIHSKNQTPFSYAINNALFNLDKQRIANNRKQSVLNQINKLRAEQPDFNESLGILHEQISQWSIGYREKVSLDLDFVRLEPSANPILSGHYEFEYPDRPTTISLEGLFFSTTKPESQPDKTVRDYLSSSKALSDASNSVVWLIYPDGNYKKIGFAYWNDNQTAIPPGSILFLAFNNPSEALLQLEQSIVSLLAWRRNYS